MANQTHTAVAPRSDALRRGINLSHWFAQARAYTAEHLPTYFTAVDTALIHSMGFDHVRWTFNDQTVVDPRRPGELDSARMKVFDTALDMLLAHDLDVIVDFHPEDPYKKALRTDDQAVDDLVSMWGALAAHLKGRDPRRVFLETMNEPAMEDPQRWNMIQDAVLLAMRKGAPRHTLIASGDKWSDPSRLPLVHVSGDANIIYNFHVYESHTFTHQGAPWNNNEWIYLKGLPYPSSPAAVAPLLPQITNETAKGWLEQYGREEWNVDQLTAWIAPTVAWAVKHGLRLTCNEFGVYRTFAPAADRCRWIKDVRSVLEANQIGWTMWDYAGGFAVAPGVPGERKPDPQVLAALGVSH